MNFKWPKFVQGTFVMAFLLSFIYIPAGLWAMAYNVASKTFIVVFWFFLIPTYIGSVIVNDWIRRKFL